MRPRTRKTWREKLANSKGLPKTSPVTGAVSRRWGAGTMVVPAPAEVDAAMRAVPQGRLTTLNQIRVRLARQHQVTFCCPITAGIFAWIAAHAAEEAAAAGAKRITPWWRTLKSDGALNPKYPGGGEFQAARLQAEGFVIELGRGRKPARVKEHEKFLVKD
jgi:hypothetical protein